MPFHVPIDEARSMFSQYDFVSTLTPSAQKAAFHVKDDKGFDLCLKIVSPDYDVDRLGREIEALQQINHPNVVKLYEYTFSSTPSSVRHYLVEEFIEGNDLEDELQTAPWELARIYTTFAELADGLTALEEIDVVHRDLKPQNVRIRIDGHPVIIDFGLARHLNLSDLTRTDEGAGLGTPLYFAPEQFLGTKRDIDRRTDLFAFGIMLFQAALGRHPFFEPGITYPELRSRVCENGDSLESDDFNALPKKLQLILRRLLARERLSRLGSAAQTSALLRKAGKNA